MKLVAFLLMAGFVMAGCASSESDDSSKKGIKNLVKLQHPSDKKRAKESNIYVDSVSVISRKDHRVLLISGNFPDGCTHLGRATHTTGGQTMRLSLSAWRDPEMMCAQVLTPFSFIYDKLAEKKVEALTSVAVNGTTYELK